MKLTRYQWWLALLLLLLLAGAGFIYSGRYGIGADEPHQPWLYWLLNETRERAITHAARDIKVPDLDDAEQLLAGGADYNDMCAQCHLKPGQHESDFSLGLYPVPPNLALLSQRGQSRQQRARENFWVIKHGIKASGMPAWGKTHDDQRIWAMVAFIDKLPQLTPEQYQILTAAE